MVGVYVVNTPSFTSLFDNASAWFKAHTLWVTVFAAGFTYITTEFAKASEFEAFQKDTLDRFILQDNRYYLEQTRKKLEILEEIPVDQQPDAIKRSIERLKREEMLLEQKISS